MRHGESFAVKHADIPVAPERFNTLRINGQGTVVHGNILLQPDAIFPHDGDEIVVRYQKPHNPAEYVAVFDNITQRKRAAEYVKEKQR